MKINLPTYVWSVRYLASMACILVGTNATLAQNFDFDRLQEKIETFSVIVEIKVEVSFGTHTNEQEERLLGTIVTDDGLFVFDGAILSRDNVYSSLSGIEVRTEPVRIEVRTFDDREFEAEYLGTDRFTQLGFAQVLGAGESEFTPVRFTSDHEFLVGEWVGLFALLPEFVQPSLAADVGMISAQIESPEEMPLTVGFSVMEIPSVLFNEELEPVGLLGLLMDPSTARTDAGGLLEGFGDFDFPLLGVITGERIERLVADPPQRGEIDRAWLGISLQALDKDIAEFLKVDADGGIIVNDVISGSPADKAGLQVGDVVYEINGRAIEVDREEKLPLFQRRIAEMGPGTTVDFSVVRPGEVSNETLMLSAVLEGAPISPADAPEYESKSFEFKVRDMVFADYLRLNQDQSNFQGVVLSEMKRGGSAMLGGLMIGDIVQRIGNQPVSTVDEVREIFGQIETDRPAEVIFFIWRDNKTMFVNVKADWD
ncbi:MAG: PDZ domain-containing protein [Candidatus Zixiibacteriota bacterium]|nr:MAG: PDZ domain-containing protein [candidate division Zixibacteria bacterium]